MQPVQLMIIGAQRAGTSSLKNYLGQHPDILTHKQREMTYFVNDSEYKRGYAHTFRRYFQRVRPEKPVLLAKSAGVMYLPEAMKRLCDLNPDIHVVISLRHPVDRAYSAYWYARRRTWEDLDTFEKAVQADPNRFGDDWVKQRNCAYLDRSMYAKHLGNVLEYFNREQVHVFLFEDIKRNIAAVCQEVYSLFGLDTAFSPQIARRHNVAAWPRSEKLAWLLSSNLAVKQIFRRLLPDQLNDIIKQTIQRFNEKKFVPPPMKPETRAQLVDYFKPFNTRLSELLGRDLSHWNVV